MDKIREQGTSPKKGVNTGKIQQTVGVTKENLLILIEPSTELNELNKEGFKVSFKHEIESPKEYTELLKFLDLNGIEDLTVKLDNGKIIENPKEAVGHDTFIFYDKGIIPLLSELYQKNVQANVIQKGNAIFISRTTH
ncbi:hypothetical protein M0P65_02235 [Candidatus Gracilibacteria bacterium]|nr:hypothetical protein [Candidatus Gracilibacteria bacterium]